MLDRNGTMNQRSKNKEGKQKSPKTLPYLALS